MATVWTVERGSETQKGNIQLQDRNGSLCQPCRVIPSRAVRFQAGGGMQGWRRSRVCRQSGTAVSVLASGAQVRSPVAGVGALHSPTFLVFFPSQSGNSACPPWPTAVRIEWDKMGRRYKMQGISGTFEKNTSLWLSWRKYFGKNQQHQAVTREKKKQRHKEAKLI